jgi:hypothetical protein
MSLATKIGTILYGSALLISLGGALTLLTGFLLAADWNVGIHSLMVVYFVLSSLGTLGLIVATLMFWSKRRVLIKIALASNIETFLFASLLTTGFLLDHHRDYSPMIVGFSRSTSFSISTVAWFAIPVVASFVGTCSSIVRTREIQETEVTPWQQ